MIIKNIFSENVWYFRNSPVRANYIDLKNGIHGITKFLEFFINILLNEGHTSRNWTLLISGTFKAIGIWAICMT